MSAKTEDAIKSLTDALIIPFGSYAGEPAETLALVHISDSDGST